jgi:gamma-glutamylcyclotransferase (GGCT)/AIG2-like uncharacterized protein YtfP
VSIADQSLAGERMSDHFVFVYGSLRRGNAGAMSVRFPEASYVAEGKVRGRLYDLGAYPGLLLDSSASMVTGEVYEVDDDTLRRLDQFELTSDYIRKQVEVEHGSERTACWIYVPERDAEVLKGFDLIESGDWIAHKRSRSSEG